MGGKLIEADGLLYHRAWVPLAVSLGNLLVLVLIKLHSNHGAKNEFKGLSLTSAGAGCALILSCGGADVIHSE